MVSQVWNDDDDIILFYPISVRGCGGERCSPLLGCSLIVEYFYIEKEMSVPYLIITYSNTYNSNNNKKILSIYI